MSDTDLYSGVDTSQFRGHPISLEFFEGPLDLLLYLVSKDKIDIRDISISRITQQYLDYLRSLEALNVEIAGEFLVMAATLMRMKSQMLLPRPQLPEEEAGLLPMTREELISKLLELQRYKEAARSLRTLEDQRRRCLPRGWTPALPKDHRYPLREIRAVDLVNYIREAMQRVDEGPPRHEVQLEEIRLEDRIEYLLERINGTGLPLLFRDLLDRPWWRLEWIVTFLAMLELMRVGKLTALQEEPFGELWLLRNGNGQEPTPAPVTAREEVVLAEETPA